MATSGMSSDLDMLFAPGNGAFPPVFAGRETELNELDIFRRTLTSGRQVPSDVILYGPRGNGKTVLLDRFQGACASGGIADESFVSVSASELESLQALRDALLPKNGGDDFLARVKRFQSARIFSLGITPEAPRKPTFTDVLRGRLEAGPLVLAVDEAHTLPVDVGHQLLNQSQVLRREKHPFLLVLAGTPDISSRLSEMKASFWERSRQVPVRRLSKKAARKALEEPLDKRGFHFAPAALNLAMRDMVEYPYFVQLWGESLTRTKADFEAKPEISANDAAKASATFAEARNRYYRRRHNELRKQGLLPVARAAARAFLDNALRTEDDLVEIVGWALDEDGRQDDDPEAVADKLIHLGFVWERNGGMVPGIPSLMDHVLAHSAHTAPRTDQSSEANVPTT